MRLRLDLAQACMSAADLIGAIGEIRSAFSGTMPRWLDGFRGALEVLAARDLMILAALFCSGRMAGFVYWGIAGRNAGA